MLIPSRSRSRVRQFALVANDLEKDIEKAGEGRAISAPSHDVLARRYVRPLRSAVRPFVP
jgi:hypothetical protein